MRQAVVKMVCRFSFVSIQIEGVNIGDDIGKCREVTVSRGQK